MENFSNKKFLTANQIIEMYKKGERDFSGIVARGIDLINVDLRGANFSKSDLSYSNFRGCNLTNTNFSEAKLSWTDFTFANLTRANFRKADLSYSIINDTIIDKADFREVDLSWSLAFNVNLHAADLRGANLTTLATSSSELTEDGIRHVEQVLGRIRPDLSLSLFLVLRRSMDSVRHLFNIMQNVPKAISTYGIKTGKSFVVYEHKPSQMSQGGSYTTSSKYIMQTQYETFIKEEKPKITYKK